METVFIEFKRATVAQRQPVTVGDVMALSKKEASYLISLGRGVEISQEDYQKRQSKKRVKSEKK